MNAVRNSPHRRLEWMIHHPWLSSHLSAKPVADFVNICTLNALRPSRPAPQIIGPTQPAMSEMVKTGKYNAMTAISTMVPITTIIRGSMRPVNMSIVELIRRS
jgi:hypothetical protein